MGTLTVTISGQPVTIIEGSISVKDTLDLRSTCSFTVRDDMGMASYTSGQPVAVIDSVAGLLFAGFVHNAKTTNMTPNAMNLIAIDCVDNHYLADKALARRDYVNQYAGDIAADLLSNYLAPLGVSASYAVRHDNTALQFGLGTTTNTVGANSIDDGDLELKNAGSTVTISETTTADFAAGTLVNTTAANNALGLNSVQALQMTAISQQGANDNYTYFKIWSGSTTIATDDQFVYTIWVSSSSPKSTGGLDLTMSDGSNLRDGNIFDQNGLFVHPKSDLSGYGVDKWYTRSFGMNDYLGKTISYMSIAQEGDANGTYTFYVRDAKILNSVGVLKQQLISGGTPSQTPVQLSDLGYSSATLKTITGYTDSGTRVSPSRSITAAGIVRSSIVSWTQSSNGVVVPNATQGPNKVNYTTVESSIDGGTTWQTCTNHGAIPNLYAGMATSGVSILFRQTLAVAGPDPTLPTNLNDFTMTVQPSYSTTITNIQKMYNSSSSWTTQGSYSNAVTNGNGDATLNGTYRNWATDALPYANITLYGSTPTMNVYQPNSCLQIRCDASSDVKASIDNAGNWTNGTIEVDVLLVDAIGNYGVCYRGVGNNSANSYAYNAFIQSTGVILAYGGGSYNPLITATVAFATGQWYHLKVVFSGTNHKIYVNDVLYINQNDSSSTSSGNVGIRHYNGNAVGGARHSGFFQNFGIIANQTGTWTSTGVSLTSLTTVGSTLIQWNDTTPTNATLLVESSTNNGSTYATCTNNAQIPGLTPGTSTSGMTLKIRATLTAQNANVTPQLHGLSTLLSSAFSSAGNRISPALSLASVGMIGDTSISWNAAVPTGTTLLIDSSPDGSTWTNVGSGASGSVAIPGIVTQPDATDDTFDSNTSSSYTSTHITGGTNATWTWDTANSRIVGTGGNNDVLQYSSISASDVVIQAALDISQNAGLVVRMVDASNLYILYLEDSSFGNMCTLWKVVAGTFTQIGSAALNFPTGTPHIFQLSTIGSTIAVSMDGVQLISMTDTGVAGPGKVGVHAGTQGRFYNFRVQPLGQSASGLLVYTRARLTSTDARYTPMLTDITASVRSPKIRGGALIPSTQYSVLAGNKVTIAAALDDLAKQSNYVWRIDKNKNFTFLPRNAQPSPWIATGPDIFVSGLDVEINADTYRNTEILVNGKDILAIPPEQKQGDGIAQSWILGYPVDSVTSILVNNVAAMVGLKGDSGKDFYYEVGSNTIIQDANDTPLDDTQTLTINYNGQVVVAVEMRNDAQIGILASLDGTDGIVEDVEDVGGLNKLAMLQMAQSRLQQYAIMSKILNFTTLRDGLLPGQVIAVTLPAFSLNDAQFLITDVSTSWLTTTQNNVTWQQPFYTCSVTNGPVVGDWVRFLMNLSS